MKGSKGNYLLLGGIVCALVFSLLFFEARADPGLSGIVSKADWIYNDSNYYGINTTQGELIVFDKTPANETGFIKFTRNNTIIAAILPFILEKAANKWYICPVWNFTETPNYGNNSGADGTYRVNYTLPNERLFCFNYNNLGDNYYDNFTIKDMAIKIDLSKPANSSIKYNITLLNGSSVNDRGFGFAFFSISGKKFAKINISGVLNNLNDSTYGTNNTVDDVELDAEDNSSTNYKWQWQDVTKNQTAERIKYRQFTINGSTYHTLSFYGYGWGSGSSWELDPVIVDVSSNGQAVSKQRHIIYDKQYNDWVYLLENTTALMWARCTDVTTNATCNIIGNTGSAAISSSIFQNSTGSAYIQTASVGGAEGRCYQRTSNATLTARAGLNLSTRQRPYVAVTPNNTFFLATSATDAPGGVAFHVSYDNCAIWENITPATTDLFQGSLDVPQVYFVESNSTVVIVYADLSATNGFNYTYCSWNLGSTGGRNDCLNYASNWSAVTRIGNTSGGITDQQQLTCAPGTNKLYCYMINSSSISGSPSRIVQGVYTPSNDSWNMKNIINTVSTSSYPNAPALAVSVLPNRTHSDALVLIYTNNTTGANDLKLKYATSNDSGVTWEVYATNLTNDSNDNYWAGSVQSLNESNSSVSGFKQAVYAWVKSDGGTNKLYTDHLDVPLPSETMPTINPMFLYTVGPQQAFGGVNNTSTNVNTPTIEFRFTDPEDSQLITSIAANGSNRVTNSTTDNLTNTNLTFGALSDNIYTVYLQANDSGNIGFNNTTETYNFIIDTTKPNITNTSQFNYSATTGISYVNISWVSNDSLYVANITFEIDRKNYSNFSNSTSPNARGQNNNEHWYNYSNTSGGNHTFKIYTNDTATNAESFGGAGTWVNLNTNTAPAVTIATTNNTTSTAAQPQVTIRATDNEQTSAYAEIFRNGTNISYSLVQNNTNTAMTWNNAATADGIYSYFARAYDNNTNNVSDGNWTLIKDTGKPNITNTSEVNYTTNASINYANISWISNDSFYVANVVLEIDSVNYTNFSNSTSPNSRGLNNMEHWYNYSNGSYGNHTFKIYTNDTAGNAESFGGSGTWFNLQQPAQQGGGAGGNAPPAGGGGGGGGAASQEIENINNVQSGTTATVLFDNSEEHYVSEITLDAKNDMHNAAVKVILLDNKPVYLPDPTRVENTISDFADDMSQVVKGGGAGTSVNTTKRAVFGYLNIDPVNFKSTDLKAATIKFLVNKDWLTKNGFADDEVYLLRYTGVWQKLTAQKTGTVNGQIIYRTTSPGLSTFAIYAEKKAPVKVVTIVDETVEEGAPTTDPGLTDVEIRRIKMRSPYWVVGILVIITVVVLAILASRKKAQK